MPLITTKELLLNAQKGGYAICAFNMENMEMAMGSSGIKKLGQSSIFRNLPYGQER